VPWVQSELSIDMLGQASGHHSLYYKLLQQVTRFAVNGAFSKTC